MGPLKFFSRSGKNTVDYSPGCRLPVNVWADFNRSLVFNDIRLRKFAAPFPPVELMQITSGLTGVTDFASQGADFWMALSEASPKPLSEYDSILDFGCGCGRLARMFKGYKGYLAGCDVDHRLVAWCSKALKYMDTRLSSVKPPIPFSDNRFGAILSVSIFSHLTESSQDQFLRELNRVCRPGGRLFLTIHGKRAFERAVSEHRIREMLNVDEDLFRSAVHKFTGGEHAFILQHGHLTTTGSDKLPGKELISEPYDYGITFIPETYLHSHWTRWFDIIDHRAGAIHDFQDIVVMEPKKI
jgi:SAM-dependent methyltransferase